LRQFSLRKRLSWISVVALVLHIFVSLSAVPAIAGNLTSTYIRLDRMRASTASNIRVVFTTSADTATEDKLKINFQDAHTIATSGITTSIATCPSETSTTALPGTFTITSSNTNGSKHVTLSGVTNLTASTAYCVDINGVITSNGAAGQYKTTVETQDSGSTRIDSTQVALRVVDGTTNWDQITVTATVPPTFSFTLSGTTDTFATDLDPASVLSTAGRTVTIATNAPGGWITWVKDSNQGLTSAIAGNYTIPTSGTVDAAPTTLVAGTEGYVLDVDLTTDAGGGCTLAIDAEYNGGASAGGTLSAIFQPVASCSGGTANNDVITLVEKAAISGNTPAAGDYTDTLTVVGAGRF
jgi:hypothetical protein